MEKLNDTYTSTGHKFFAHQEAMKNLKNGKGQCITTHVMLCDYCQHQCAFCSVAARAGDSLNFNDVLSYLDILIPFGLKSVILSGGGNPILYKCKDTGKNFNDVVDAIHARGLQIGLITNGMLLKKWENVDYVRGDGSPLVPNMIQTASEMKTIRESWATVRPETLDKLTWVRISMAGLDHEENEVYVPDIDPEKTTLGFSYCAHDVFDEPADPHHGKVSTPADLITLDRSKLRTWTFNERIPELTEQLADYVDVYKPKYLRLLPNCLEKNLIAERCGKLSEMAKVINERARTEVAFVQHKPPSAPNVCLIGAIHPVLNCDGFVYPCDAVVLAAAEIGYQEGKPNHKFDNPWRICHWSKIADLYENKLPRSLIDDPKKKCQGCVFTAQNLLLEAVANGTIDPVPPAETPEHVNFV